MQPVGGGGIRFQYATANFTLGLGLSSDIAASATLDALDIATGADDAVAAFKASPGLTNFRLLGRQLMLSSAASAPASLAGSPFPKQAAADTRGAPVPAAASAAKADGGELSDGDDDAGAPPKDSRPPPLGGPEFVPISFGGGEKGAVVAKPLGLKVAQAPTAGSSAQIEAIGKKPYWMRALSNISSPFLRLHNEMVELCELLQATAEEEDARNAAVAQISDVVTAIWPAAQVVIFGSFATGLYVPTSDVDLVVLDSDCGNKQTALKALAEALKRKGVAKGVQVIGKAKVPIIKFETIDHGSLAIDISFDVANGPEAADMVKEFVRDWPMMRPLILVLKLFLQQRELNEVYTGGIGSYGLITMVTAFLQQHRSRFRAASAELAAKEAASGGRQTQKQAGQAHKASHVEPNLAVLLVDFFRLYGRVLNVPVVGISSADGGTYFAKADKNWTAGDRPHLLSVEDPKDPTNDISRNSWNIMKVKMAFDYAYSQLTAPSSPSESLLARVLRLGPILASRQRPAVGAKHLPYSAPPTPTPAAGVAAAAAKSAGGGSPERASKKSKKRRRDKEASAKGGDGSSPADGEEDVPAGTSGRGEAAAAGKRKRKSNSAGPSDEGAASDMALSEGEAPQPDSRRKRRSDGDDKQPSGGGERHHHHHSSGGHHHHHSHHEDKPSTRVPTSAHQSSGSAGGSGSRHGRMTSSYAVDVGRPAASGARMYAGGGGAQGHALSVGAAAWQPGGAQQSGGSWQQQQQGQQDGGWNTHLRFE